jgi:hypothetical protein
VIIQFLMKFDIEILSKTCCDFPVVVNIGRTWRTHNVTDKHFCAFLGSNSIETDWTEKCYEERRREGK